MVQQFLRPASPAEAVAFRKDTGGPFLAGGTDLNYRDSSKATTVVSLAALPLRFLRTDGPVIELGPTVTLQELADHAALGPVGLEVLRLAANQVGNRSIRNLATLGGSLGANKSHGDVIPPLIVLDGTVSLVTDGGEQEMTVEHYVAAPPAGALIVAVRVPRPDSALQVALQRFSRSASDFAVVNAALAVRVVAGKLAEPRLALGGVASTVVRVPEAEAVLAGAGVDQDLAGLLDRFSEAVAANITPPADERGSASFRADLAVTLARRALVACTTEKGG